MVRQGGLHHGPSSFTLTLPACEASRYRRRLWQRHFSERLTRSAAELSNGLSTNH